MYKYQAKNAPKQDFLKLKNCTEACDKCKMCRKDTREYDQCWSSCDACSGCQADEMNARVYDEPYEVRPWFLTQQNHSYAMLPYTMQYCDNICGVRMCKRYRKQQDAYEQCKRCQLKQQCWSQVQEKCVDCSHTQYTKPCEQRFGCPNPNGGEFANVAPIDPMFTNCMPCWNSGN